MVVPKKGTSTLLARPCRVAVRWLAFQQGTGVSCRRVLLLLLGAHAASVVVVFAHAAVGFVLGLHVRVVRCPQGRGLLKATGPMSPSHVQRVKCPSREHKLQFVPLLGATFFSSELRLGGLRGSLGGGLGVPLQGRGSARFVGGGSWIVGARRWRVANLREGPLRLDLHLEAWKSDLSGCRGVPEGHVLVAVWTTVALRWRGFPLVLLRRIGLGGGVGSSWWSSGAVWSEEEVAELT
ncbi:hypothetical protein Taro_039060 [Colocasia esculenta]|uniref:Uncharacterized protein n=1 Tax=Colocasia esculenta TaxID=4460 RepID=A0A843W9N8_COLES|nr:hypothetical protein [Colocasia esculenta]